MISTSDGGKLPSLEYYDEYGDFEEWNYHHETFGNLTNLTQKYVRKFMFQILAETKPHIVAICG